MPKISVIGAGAVGAQCAFYALIKKLGDVVLIDVVEGVAKGKALDLLQALPLLGSEAAIVGGSDYALTENSDMVIITAGLPRKPGMTREQLLDTNAKIVKDIASKVCKLSPNSILLVMTNPLDAMAFAALKNSGFPRERVIGQAGVLDSARFRAFLAQELKVGAKNIDAPVLGSHGEEMVPVPSLVKVNGGPVEVSKNVVERTRNAGAEIVNLMQSSAFFAPAVSIVEMAESILKDQKRTMCCSVFLKGEYGVSDCCIGVPVVLGRKGVEKVVELKLSPSEASAFQKAYNAIASMQKNI